MSGAPNPSETNLPERNPFENLPNPDVIHESVRVWRCGADRARVEVGAGDPGVGERDSDPLPGSPPLRGGSRRSAGGPDVCDVHDGHDGHDGRDGRDGRDHRHDPDLERRINERWRELTARNPRLFDGPMLAVESFDPQHGLVIARRERYRRLAVQPEVATGVCLLAVKGVVLRRAGPGRAGRAGTGEPETLMIRRAPGTHMYGGMWEIGPAGGVDPEPGAAPALIAHEALSRELARELREESGVVWNGDNARLIAMFTSDASFCLNVVLQIELEHAIINDAARSWDADAIEWVPVRELPAFVERVGLDHVVPNSVALGRFLGWQA